MTDFTFDPDETTLPSVDIHVDEAEFAALINTLAHDEMEADGITQTSLNAQELEQWLDGLEQSSSALELDR